MFLSFSRFFMVTNAEWVVWFQKISRRFTTVCVSCVRSLCCIEPVVVVYSYTQVGYLYISTSPRTRHIMSALKIALQDASHALLEAVEKKKVGDDMLNTGMNPTATLPVLRHDDSESNSRVESPPQQPKHQQQHHWSRSNDGKNSEDPIMAAFLEVQRPPALNFDDWGPIWLLSNQTLCRTISCTVERDSNASIAVSWRRTHHDNRNTRPRLAQRMIEVNLYNRNRRSGSPTGSKYCALLIVDFNNLWIQSDEGGKSTRDVVRCWHPACAVAGTSNGDWYQQYVHGWPHTHFPRPVISSASYFPMRSGCHSQGKFCAKDSSAFAAATSSMLVWQSQFHSTHVLAPWQHQSWNTQSTRDTDLSSHPCPWPWGTCIPQPRSAQNCELDAAAPWRMLRILHRHHHPSQRVCFCHHHRYQWYW